MNVDLSARFHILSLFSGIGGLDIAVRIAVPHARTITYVEGEAPACAQLAAHMENGVLDEAPIWSDVTTFDAKPLRGGVDCVIAGAPCQPYSVAGKRQGDQDERYLWADIFRIIDECTPAVVFLENVPGLLQWFRPIGEELSRLGFEFEAGIFSASECGASHKRERLFVLAHRHDRLQRTQAALRSGGAPLSWIATDWPTPNVPNGGRKLKPEYVATKGSTPEGKRQVGLENAAEYWSTPQAHNSQGAPGTGTRLGGGDDVI